jgi:class 3 adenylate cyclase
VQAAEKQWLLTHNLLPRNVQQKLRNGEIVVAEHHQHATVLWAEVVGLPSLVTQLSPVEFVVTLNNLYSSWEQLCDQEVRQGVWKGGHFAGS